MSGDRDRLQNRLIRLGDMMGDGMHREPGMSWISREYRVISESLYPEIKKARLEKSKIKRDRVNTGVSIFLENNFCNCSGKLKQSCSGSKVVYCIECGKRYVIRSSKNKKRS